MKVAENEHVKRSWRMSSSQMVRSARNQNQNVSQTILHILYYTSQ